MKKIRRAIGIFVVNREKRSNQLLEPVPRYGTRICIERTSFQLTASTVLDEWYFFSDVKW